MMEVLDKNYASYTEPFYDTIDLAAELKIPEQFPTQEVNNLLQEVKSLCFQAHGHKTTKQNGILTVSTSAFLENALKIKKAKSKKKKGGECPVDGGDDKKKHGLIPHGQLWFIEKLISIMLIPVVPLAIFYPNPLFDLLLIFTLIGHIHWGIVGTVIDYVRPIIVGDTGAKIAFYACYGISIFICLGLLNLAIRGPGIGNSFQTLWSM